MPSVQRKRWRFLSLLRGHFRSHAVHFFRAKLNKKSGCCFKPSFNFLVFLLQLFDTLVSFFPEHMTQPKGNLVDLITF